MKTAKNTTRARVTIRHKRSQLEPLSVRQLNAVDALATGRTDAETAELVQVRRETVTRWRLYNPQFVAALNVRRAETWATAGAKLAALLPRAIEVIGEELAATDRTPERYRAALDLLKMIPPSVSTAGPMDPDEVVRDRVEELRRRRRLEQHYENERHQLDPFHEVEEMLPAEEELRAEVLADITARLEEPAAGPDGPGTT